MKLKCDLIIQNFNNPVNRQVANNPDKVHKNSTIGLYRPRDEEDDTDFDKKPIILTIETKTQCLKYRLKKIETSTKFIQEGRATLKLINENIFILISNCVSLTLINFISFLNVKITKAAINDKAQPEKNPKVKLKFPKMQFSILGVSENPRHLLVECWQPGCRLSRTASEFQNERLE